MYVRGAHAPDRSWPHVYDRLLLFPRPNNNNNHNHTALAHALTTLLLQVRLTNAIADVIQDFGLVFFIPLDIQSEDSKKNVMQSADKACGYLFEDRLDETSASNVARDVAAAN